MLTEGGNSQSQASKTFALTRHQNKHELTPADLQQFNKKVAAGESGIIETTSLPRGGANVPTKDHLWVMGILVLRTR